MMDAGRCDALSSVLKDLCEKIKASACLIVDERGLMISEHVKNGIDKNAMAIMSSLLSGTSNRFIKTLNLQKMNAVTLSTPKGTFFIKEVPISGIDRTFTLSTFIEKSETSKEAKRQKQGTKRLRQLIESLINAFPQRKKPNLDLHWSVKQSIEEIKRIFNT